MGPFSPTFLEQLALAIISISSYWYIAFVIGVVVLYYLFHRSYLVLLLASIVFYLLYSWKFFIFVYILSIITFLAGKMIFEKKRRMLVLCAAIIGNIAILGYVKYRVFFIQTILELLIHQSGPVPTPVVPLGLSFMVFGCIHYLVDIYKGKKPVRNFLQFFLFILFFPTVVAGPIRRFESFVRDITHPTCTRSMTCDGIYLVIKGMFKKSVLVSLLAPVVVKGFAGDASAENIILGIYAYTCYIYLDFSGYTDIARGSAAFFGIHIEQNFFQPYLATSVRVFWRRWHITLMSWFRDYLYIPMGGSRKGSMRHIINIIIVFAVSGLWHGAAWHFILWGMYHGALVGLETLLRPIIRRIKLPNVITIPIGIFYTFHVVAIGWVIFRVDNMNWFMDIVKKISMIRFGVIPLNENVLFAGIVLSLYFIFWFIMRISSTKESLRLVVRNIGYGVALVMILLNLSGSLQQFIYAQF